MTCSETARPCYAAVLACTRGRSPRTTSGEPTWCHSATAPSPPGLLTISPTVASYTPGNLGAFNGDSSFGLKKGDDSVPYTQNWNLIASQQVPWKSTLEVQYAGNRTRNALLTGNGSNQNFFQNINKIPLGALYGPDPVTGTPCPANSDKGLTCDPDKWSTSQLQDFRPYLNYGKALIDVTHGSYSNYNALMMSWQKQAGKLTFSTNYTYSKLLGIRDGQTNNGNGDGVTVNPFNVHDNYGVLAYDHTHIFNATYIYYLPSPIRGNKFLEGAVNGWEFSGITQWQSGPPLQPLTNGNFHAGLPVSAQRILGTDQSAHLSPYLTCDPHSGRGDGQYFNPNCFAVPDTVGVNGQTVWPYIKGPAYFNSDVTFSKNFKITERQNLQFRWSAFNFLNHPLKQFELANDTTVQFQACNSGTVSYASCSGATFGSDGNQPANLPLDQIKYYQSNPNFTGKPVYSVGRRVMEFALKYTF